MRISTYKLKTLFFIPWLSFLSLPFIGAKGACYLFLWICAASIIFIVLRHVGQVRKLSKEMTLPKLSFNPKYFIAVSTLFVLVLPLWAENYYIDVAVLAGIYIILAIGLNVMIGYAGLLNLGFAAFYAIGAYSSALFMTKFGLGFWNALSLSLILTAISGFLLAFPALRLRGDYLAIVTLGFGEIVRIVLNNWDELTNGPKGITGIPHPNFFNINHRVLSYYIIIILLAFVIFVVEKLNKSRIGRAWLAIREDEIAAQTMGIDTTKMKLLAFAIGGSFAGIGGAFFAHWAGFVSPESFTFYESVLILCMVVLGGLANIPGCLIGATILSLLPEILRDFRTYRMLIFGFLLVVIMILKERKLFIDRI